jgi:para-aminobenzoate synthetase/4-amino-4-deoxychorismate lyase
MLSDPTRKHATRWIPLPRKARKLAAEHHGAILLETSRFDSSNKYSYLFLNPVSTISTFKQNEIPEVFSKIEEALAHGLYVAGYFAYECGYHFEPSVGTASSQELPLVWLGIYERPQLFDHERGRFENADVVQPSEADPPESADRISDHIGLGITGDQYCRNVLKIKEYIASGDTYQVNFTDEVSFHIKTSPSALFEALLEHQPVSYAALMQIAGCHIISLSPELFFRIGNGHITTRPMKGTMPRGLNYAEDEDAILRLRSDVKNRSEHVMIVDLLRSDLGRICALGSVHVEDLFSVEKYNTLLQMTSTVSGALRPGISYYDIFRGIFPSGSITGAPKIRTMQIIRELERNPRGVYTGAIGFFSPRGESVFNVAIRTLVLKNNTARMGVGGGIVADSDPQDEYGECLLKAAFLTRTRHDCQLIETMLWDNGIRLLPLHLDRMGASARYFNFFFDRDSLLEKLQKLTDKLSTGKRYRLRLLLSASGDLTMNTSEIQAEQFSGHVKLSGECTSSTDLFLRHKTTRREFYDKHYADARANGFDEVIFTNEKGELTEGAVSNIFVKQGGRLLTPPLTCGVLPGVFRRHLLETSAITAERILTVEDLSAGDEVFLCNSVRGLRKITLSICDDRFRNIPGVCSSLSGRSTLCT